VQPWDSATAKNAGDCSRQHTNLIGQLTWRRSLLATSRQDSPRYLVRRRVEITTYGDATSDTRANQV
jgi:hypothetical protein